MNFETTDLVFAALLMEKGFEFVGIVTTDTWGKAKFLFEHDPKIEKLKQEYLKSKVRVEPVGFNNSMRQLKTMAQEKYE